jgi:hypothetical protein
MHKGRQVCIETGRHIGRQAYSQAGRLKGRIECIKAGRHIDRQADRHIECIKAGKYA